MLNIERILGQDRLLRATTGLNRKAFEELLVKFEAVYLSWSQKRKKPRQRKSGGGRKARLTTIKEKLFYILFYFNVSVQQRKFVMSERDKSNYHQCHVKKDVVRE